MKKVKVVNILTSELIGVALEAIVDLYSIEEVEEVNPEHAKLQRDLVAQYHLTDVVGYLVDTKCSDEETLRFLYTTADNVEEMK